MENQTEPEDVGDELKQRELPEEEELPYEPHEAWRARFDAYDPQYLGPVSWCRFLKTVAATGLMSFARQIAGVGPGVVHRRRQRYPEFDEAVANALDHFNHAVLERAAFVRAIDGVKRPIVRKDSDGEPMVVGHEIQYSDTLMNTLLKGKLSDVYRDRHEHTGADGGAIIVQLQPVLAKAL